MTTTSTFTFTFTQTAIHMTDVILGSIADIVATLGLNATRSAARTRLDHAAIQQWIEEKSLASVALEFTDPNGVAVEIFEFDVSYGTYGSGDVRFHTDQTSLERYRKKLKMLPSGSTWRMVAMHNGPRTQMPGWSSTSRASTEGMRSTTFGTIGSAPGASSTLRHYTR